MAYRVSYRGNRGFTLGLVGFLIIINIIMFIVTTIRPELIYTIPLGLSRQEFTSSPWTIITNLFIHAGIWHILANMLTLYFFGSYLSRLVGDRNSLIIYFLGGLLGNVVFLLLAPSNYMAIGASGAVFAVAGALTVLRPKMTVFIIPIPVPIPLWIAVIGGFAILSIPQFSYNIAWQAHLGGLVVGLVAGYIFRRRQRRFY
jgi:membrane associated rhomboid family serine protease